MITELPWAVGQGAKELALPSGTTVSISVSRLRFSAWSGVQPRSRWNNKPVVGPPQRPFAELAIVGQLSERGWVSAWVTYPGKFRTSWEPRGYTVLPEKAAQLFQRVSERVGGPSGAWDVYAWKNGEPLFVEVKWPGDVVRESQRRWLAAALDLKIAGESFIVAECEQLPNNRMEPSRR